MISDSDPYDSFCSDDQAVVCKKMPTNNIKPSSNHASDRQRYKCITVECRPYNLRKETNIPDWCPIILNDSIKNSKPC